MIRVRNAHGALCHGILPGAEGDVDESNRGVAAALVGGLLVRVSEAPAAEGGESLPSHAEALAMLEEIDRRGTVITGLRDELDAARNRVGQLEAEVADAVRRADNEASASILNREHGQRLEAEIEQLKLDLEAATAPAKDPKDPTAKKKSAATAEG